MGHVCSVIQILGTPVVAITLILVALERALGFGFFDPKQGGDPILMQHLFWFCTPGSLHHDSAADGRDERTGGRLHHRRIFGYHFVAMRRSPSPY
ncbi:MAG: hypothetical protein U0Q16_36905 [Bryobacteraceae bacterium]